MLAEYNRENFNALKTLKENDTITIKPFSPEILQKAQTVREKVLNELNTPGFKAVYQEWQNFRERMAWIKMNQV